MKKTKNYLVQDQELAAKVAEAAERSNSIKEFQNVQNSLPNSIHSPLCENSDKMGSKFSRCANF